MTFRRATGVRLQTGIPFAFVRIPQEHFDAVKIGLTATPALHTVSIFGDPIFKYSYREAVIDDDLIDHEAPVQITTALSKSGTRFAKDEEIEMIDPRTGKVDLARTPDEIRLRCDEFNKNVVTTLLPISNQECFPGLTRNATDARGTGCRQTFLRPGRTGLK